MGRSLALAAAFVAFVSCTGTTGYDLVSFYAVAAGPADAQRGQPYSFTSDRGFRVQLTRATLHVGALYLDQSLPTAGSAEGKCTLPGTYVGEVLAGLDVDMLSPDEQLFPTKGVGSTIPAAVGQVWLSGPNVYDPTDSTVVLSIAGNAASPDGSTSYPFSGDITIDQDRFPAMVGAALPGSSPICEKRIVTPIVVDMTLAQSGTLVLHLDPSALFSNVDFSSLTQLSQDPPAYGFTNDPAKQTQADTNLFANLRAAGAVYRFDFRPTAPTQSVPPDLDGGATMDSTVADGDGADGRGEEAGVEAGATVTLPMNPPVDQGSLQSAQLLLTASGEKLAIDGYDFPALSAGAPVFADGWQIRFDHFLATFDKVSLWTNPDSNITTQQLGPMSQLVAELDGPWAVDLSQNGASWPYIDGKEPGERAIAFAVLRNENKNGGAPFPTNGDRLAVGFSAVVATPDALNVNLGPSGLAYYTQMIQQGCVVLYVGQATWRGDQPGGVCVAGAESSDASAPAGGKGQEAEFANIPKVVQFDLCFKPRTPLGAGAVETSWINCDNQDNDPAAPLNGEPHQRGIAFKSNTYSTGEVTFHSDHPFWESTEHDTPPHFDQFAAMVSGGDGGIPTVHLEDTTGEDYTAFKDRQGNAVPWRICDPNYQNPNGGSRLGPMHFDPVSVPHCANDDSTSGLCDYYDFSKYDQSTQGHWNGADGLCFVKRSYGSPP